MDEEAYLKWVLKKADWRARSEAKANAIKRKLMVYKFVPRGVDININEPFGVRYSDTVGLSYIVSGILFSHALCLFM